MRAHFCRLAALVMVVVAWLCNPSGEVQAHPQLAGDWVSTTPPGGFQVFRFRLGQHLGNGLWQGDCSINVSNVSILVGEYTLNMIDDHQATLVPLRNATNLSPTVGIVDFTTGVLSLKNVEYRRRGPAMEVPYPSFVGPLCPAR
jgi:hypothetical protein